MERQFDSPGSNSRKRILSLAFAVALLVPIGIFNSYIFLESNLPLLLVLLAGAAILCGPAAVPVRITFPAISAFFVLFVVYAWSRLDNPLNFDFNFINSDGTRPGIMHVADLIVFHMLFVIAAVLYYRHMKLALGLWFLICGYIVAYILRNSMDIAGLQSGYNLSPGFVVITALPFVFLMHRYVGGLPRAPVLLLFFCVLWLSLIGARTAVVALLLYFFLLSGWSVIASNRWTFYGAFWGVILLVASFKVAYILYALGNPVNDLLNESLIGETGVGILEKRLGTRVEIWIHLLFLISQEPWFGYGADWGTLGVPPVSFISFSLNRDNLGAHSTYFELLYRLGAIGLLVYLSLLFSVWKLFWSGRHLWPVRVAGAFLLSVLFFGSTGEFMVFSSLPLRSGFGWIILGIGAGACLHATRMRKQAARVAATRPYQGVALPASGVALTSGSGGTGPGARIEG